MIHFVKRRPKPSAFTLIELLATTALIGLLMVTLMQVVVATSRARDVMSDETSTDQAWQDGLAQAIRSDLSSARDIRWQDEKLVIEGWGGWERDTFARHHEPAVVTYRVIDYLPPEYVASTSRRSGGPEDGKGTKNSAVSSGSSSGGGVLVREQWDVLDLGQQEGRRTLMALGIEAINWETEEELDDESPFDQEEDTGIHHTPRLTIVLAGNETPLVIPAPRTLGITPRKDVPRP